MSANIKGITPLNWKALVYETLQRRKAEKMTQREHAALANVSIPTMAAFESGETSLSLAKAFDILRVVGLVDEPAEEGEQDVFVSEAFTRWRTLSDHLPKESYARFPHGWFRFDYYLEGDFKHIEPKNFVGILKKAVTNHSGWPPFLIMKNRPEKMPYEVNGLLECWLQPSKEDVLRRADCYDFWRASPNGQMFLLRGYEEDSSETSPPGAIFDTLLPVLRMGEVLLHAERLAILLQKDSRKPIIVHFRALYAGLSGRVLRAWANPFSNILGEGRAARSNEALLEASIPAFDISPRLAEHLYQLALSLYEKFGETNISKDFVQSEVKRFFSKEKSTL